MSLLEWFFESKNRGSLGRIERGREKPNEGTEPPQRRWNRIAMVAGWLLLGLVIYWLFIGKAGDHSQQMLVKLIVLLGYLALGHLFNPKPRYDNLGWLGGAVDNPFRISDDFNRSLLLLKVVLFPARLMAYSLFMGCSLLLRLLKKSGSRQSGQF